MTNGNQARTSFGSRSIANRKLDDSYGEDGETIWLSFLGQAADRTGGARWAGISLGPNALYFGKPNQESNWGIRHTIDDGGTVTSTPADLDVFFVARIDYKAGAEDIYMWINPLLDEMPDVDDADAFVQESLPVFDTITLAGRWSTDFDEIRLGTTYRSVAPIVPTPGVAGLLAFAGLAAARRRRA